MGGNGGNRVVMGGNGGNRVVMGGNLIPFRFCP